MCGVGNILIGCVRRIPGVGREMLDNWTGITCRCRVHKTDRRKLVNTLGDEFDRDVGRMDCPVSLQRSKPNTRRLAKYNRRVVICERWRRIWILDGLIDFFELEKTTENLPPAGAPYAESRSRKENIYRRVKPSFLISDHKEELRARSIAANEEWTIGWLVRVGNGGSQLNVTMHRQIAF